MNKLSWAILTGTKTLTDDLLFFSSGLEMEFYYYMYMVRKIRPAQDWGLEYMYMTLYILLLKFP